MDITKKTIKEIINIGACSKFHADNLVEIIEQLKSPNGSEWVIKHGFPTITIFREFKKLNIEKYGVYLDAGEITLKEARSIVLIGNTTATLKYSDTAGNEVLLLHGASACIAASGFAVVKLEKDEKSNVSYIVNDHAKVL